MNVAISSSRRATASSPITVGGFVPLSTTDYPGGHLAAVLFLQGCPRRGADCHNPSLQSRRGAVARSWDEVMDFLDSRRGLLDAVVFSGGEPTLQAGLGAAIDEVRSKGFRVGLHTAGIYPRRLRELLPKVDWVGLDVKAPFGDYARIVGRPTDGAGAQESLDLVLESGVEHEVRLTFHSRLFDAHTLLGIANGLARRGVRSFALQEFRAIGCRDANLAAQTVQPLPAPVVDAMRRLFPRFELRRSEELQCL